MGITGHNVNPFRKFNEMKIYIFLTPTFQKD